MCIRDSAGNAKSVAGKMCDYIEENLGHNITRHSLSEALFFLSLIHS